KHVRAVRLKDVAVDPRPWLIRQAALQRFSRLPVLQIDAPAKLTACVGAGNALEHYARLVQAEVVARHVVSAKEVDAPNRPIEVEAVIRIQAAAVLQVAKVVE